MLSAFTINHCVKKIKTFFSIFCIDSRFFIDYYKNETMNQRSFRETFRGGGLMATIKDVASMAEVSISTVSKYMNGGNVRPEYADRIRQSISQLDYRANPCARNLKNPRSRSVGVLLPTMKVAFFGNIVTALDKTLRDSGYHTVICCYDSDHGLERQYLSFLLSNGVDGLVYVPEDLAAEEYEELTQKCSIPVVQLDRFIQGVQTDAVLVDNTAVSYNATAHLIAQGHRRIGMVVGSSNISTSRERLVGYLRALSDSGIPYDDSLVCSGGYLFSTGYQSFQRLMELESPPTAILGGNNDITIGIIAADRDRQNGGSPPVTIFGYDCVDVCSIMRPRIPVVQQPEAEIGRTAGLYLLDRLSGFDGAPRISRLKSTLVL